MYGKLRARIGLAITTLVLVALLVAPASGHAAALCPGDNGYRTHADCPTFVGWAKTRGDTSGPSCSACLNLLYGDARIWRYSNGAWAQGSVASETWIYAYPFGSPGWSWGYVWPTREWVAIRSSNIIVCGYYGQSSSEYRACAG